MQVFTCVSTLRHAGCYGYQGGCLDGQQTGKTWAKVRCCETRLPNQGSTFTVR